LLFAELPGLWRDLLLGCDANGLLLQKAPRDAHGSLGEGEAWGTRTLLTLGRHCFERGAVTEMRVVDVASRQFLLARLRRDPSRPRSYREWTWARVNRAGDAGDRVGMAQAEPRFVADRAATIVTPHQTLHSGA
jgi:hypothetical protein